MMLCRTVLVHLILASITLVQAFIEDEDDLAGFYDQHFLSDIYEAGFDKDYVEDYQDYQDRIYFPQHIERTSNKFKDKEISNNQFQKVSKNSVNNVNNVAPFSSGKTSSHTHEHKHTNDHTHAHQNVHQHEQQHKHKAVHTHIHKHDHHHEHNHHHKHAADHQHEQDHKHAHEHKHKHH